MKIQILKSCSGLSFSVAKGETREDLADEICKDLIKAKYAKPIKTQPKKK